MGSLQLKKKGTLLIVNLSLEFDCGSLTHDAESRKKYQKASGDYFKYNLLQIGSRPALSSFTNGQQKALLCWDEVGQHIRETCSRGIFLHLTCCNVTWLTREIRCL
jgi:hypothetical protein